jgi:hypothetical protein
METMMVTRRRVLITIGLAVAGLCEPAITAADQKARKTQPVTITLKIDGMG